MGAILTTRDGLRPKGWQLALLTVLLAMAVGMVRSGASWGSSGYDPASDSYSMQNITAGDGVQAWWNAGLTGKGVDVALIDTGVTPVAGLNAPGKVINGPDLSLDSQDPSLQHLDSNGHGTFMAGLIAGNDGQAGGYRGVAPDSSIVSVKVGVTDGGVDVSQVIAAIDWVVQHRHDNGMNIRVINLSYGTNSNQAYGADPLAFAVEQAWKAGIVVVAAAGNSGYQNGASAQGLADPAYDPQVLAVGAADTMGSATPWDDQVASYSASAASCSTGCRAPDLIAPGSHMQGLRVPGSYIDQTSPGGVLSDRYFRGSGTSQATAFTSGAVADLLQRYPQLTPDQVKAMLTSSCDKLSSYNWKQQGCGELDMSQLLGASVPSAFASQQYNGPSTGTGLLEASRGTDHISINGVLLQGERDIFGKPFSSAAMAALEAAGSSWSGGVWNGSVWTGSSWSGSSWSGSSWSGSSWSGSSWSGSSWSGSSWSGSSWSGSSWSGSSWSGSSWSGSSWSGGSWLGASWG
ncbi:MAG TPA: S8 family serine peptidase [Gaiellaceae bacterium]|nr:S8 family serine peptidase [Gaiellaceae bacterium]